MKKNKILILVFILLVLLLSLNCVYAKRSIRDPNFNLNDNLEKDLHKYNNINKGQYNNFKNGKELKQNHGFKIDDLDIDSTLISYWRDGQSMYFELNMSQRYMVWVNSGVKHKPISYRQYSDTYIVQFINLENWELHVGKNSDVWTDPATTKNGLIFWNGTIQSSVAVDYATTGPQQYNGTLVNGVTSSWDGTSRNFALAAASSQLIRNQDAPTNTWPFSIGAWVKMPAKSAVESIIGIFDKDANQKQLYIGLDATGTPQCNVQTGGGTRIAQATTQIDDNNWHHIWCNFDQSNRTIFIDGVPEGSNTVVEATIPGIDRFSIGGIDDLGTTNYWTGDITGIVLFNDTKNSTFVSFINSQGRQYEYNITVPPTVSVTNVNLSNQPIFYDTVNTTCTADVTNAVTTYYQWLINTTLIYNTTNIITLNNTNFSINNDITCRVAAYNGTGFAQSNITVTVSPPSLDYLNVISDSNDWPRNMFCNYSVTRPDTVTQQWIVNNSVMKTNDNYFNVSDFTTNILGKDIFCRVISSVPSQNFTTINDSLSSTIGNTINFTAIDMKTGSPVLNFTIWYSSRNVSSNNTGSALVYNYNVTETYNLTSPTYISDAVNLTTNVSNQSYQFVIFKNNNIFLIFIDEVTELPIQNVSFDIKSDVFSSNFNTGNGNTINVSDLPPTTYEIRFGLNSTYFDRSYFFSIPLIDEDELNITLRLLQQSQGSLFVRNVIGDDALPLSGDILEIQRFYVNASTSGEWLTTEMALIDSEGEAVFHAQGNTVNYRFRILRNLTLLTVLEKTFLTSANSDIVVRLEGDLLDNFNSYRKISGVISYDNVTDSFLFDYLDSDGSSNNVCMFVTRSYLGKTYINETCSSASSATLIIPINESAPGSYFVTGIANYDEEQYTIDSESFNFNELNAKDSFGWVGPLLFGLAMMVAGVLGVYVNPLPGLVIAVLATIVFTTTLLGLFVYSPLIIGGVLILSMIIYWLFKKV